MYIGKCVLSGTPTFLAIFLDKLFICGNQCMCSSTITPRNLVCLTRSILLPCVSIDAPSVSYVLLFDVNIMKLVFFVFSKSLFVQNRLESIFSSPLVSANSELKFLCVFQPN